MTPEILKQRRKALGFTGNQMGKYLGVAGSCIYNWENGYAPISKMAIKLLNTLEKLEQLQQPALPLAIPKGVCRCGCGGTTEINTRNDRQKGWVRGEYRDFIKGHNARAMGREESHV